MFIAESKESLEAYLPGLYILIAFSFAVSKGFFAFGKTFFNVIFCVFILSNGLIYNYSLNSSETLILF